MKSWTIRTVLAVMALLPFVSAQDISVKNTSSLIGNGRWAWTVYIDAPLPILDKVRCVEYHLHPTFPNPLHVVCERGQQEPFALHGNGWGEFNVVVKVTFLDGTVQPYNHWLTLSSSTATEPPPKKSVPKKRPPRPVGKQQG
jgi:transcription initiation factor IIF auxiliary subunit